LEVIVVVIVVIGTVVVDQLFICNSHDHYHHHVITVRFMAGAGGGVCQVVVMGPCTFLVTAVVTGDKNVSVAQKTKEVWAAKGIKVRKRRRRRREGTEGCCHHECLFGLFVSLPYFKL